jgi:hypothetical protein
MRSSRIVEISETSVNGYAVRLVGATKDLGVLETIGPDSPSSNGELALYV